jgi:hypothetical protein
MNSEMEFHRYAAAACGLMLIVGLVLGASGYAGIRGAVRRAAVTAGAQNSADRSHEADGDRVVTPAAVALALIAALLLGVAAAPSRTAIAETSGRRYPIDTD